MADALKRCALVPLETIVERRDQQQNKLIEIQNQLTTDARGCLEDAGYLRIQVNHHLVLLLDLLVPRPHLNINPVQEGLAYDRVADA